MSRIDCYRHSYAKGQVKHTQKIRVRLIFPFFISWLRNKRIFFFYFKLLSKGQRYYLAMIMSVFQPK